MANVFDLEPATREMAALVAGVSDKQLSAPTPCPNYTLGDLLDHVGGLTVAFTRAATKDLQGGSPAPSGDGAQLGDGWRERITQGLAGLAAAWRDPQAWTGMTKAGGIDLPGEVAAVVALDELVIHGWDIAQASGQAYTCDPGLLEAVYGFVAQFAGPEMEGQRRGLFGPVVEVPEDAPRLDQVVGLTGRDPAWSAATGTDDRPGGPAPSGAP